MLGAMISMNILCVLAGVDSISLLHIVLTRITVNTMSRNKHKEEDGQ